MGNSPVDPNNSMTQTNYRGKKRVGNVRGTREMTEMIISNHLVHFEDPLQLR